MISATRLAGSMFWCANTFCLIVGLIMALICALFMNSVQNVHLIYCLFGLVVGLLSAVSALAGYKAIRPPKAVIMWLCCALFTILFVIEIYIATHFQASNIITDTAEYIKLLWERELVSEGPMASMESRFRCCGLNSYRDYISLNMPVPFSCFYMENDAWMYYSDGCLAKVTFAAGRASYALSIAGFVLTSTQLLALISSFVLALLFNRVGEYEML